MPFIMLGTTRPEDLREWMREQHPCGWWQRYMGLVSAIVAAQPGDSALCEAGHGPDPEAEHSPDLYGV